MSTVHIQLSQPLLSDDSSAQEALRSKEAAWERGRESKWLEYNRDKFPGKRGRFRCKKN